MFFGKELLVQVRRNVDTFRIFQNESINQSIVAMQKMPVIKAPVPESLHTVKTRE